MAAGSLIGFFAVFVVASWSLSIVAICVLGLSGSRLQSLGPAAEKRAAALTTTLPIVFGALITLVIAFYSAAPELFGGSDHCGVHGHHPHLCLVHGGVWADQMWAVIAFSAIAALFAVRAAHLASTILVGRRQIRVIEESSRCSHHDGIAINVAPSQKDFCFAAGYLRPRILVSSSLWTRLDTAQRDAVIAHEIAHIRNRDLWQSFVLSVFEIFRAPLFTRPARLAWEHATERLCDRIAAEQVDSATVAEALLSWVRAGAPKTVMPFSQTADAVEERVVAVLSEQPKGDLAAVRIARIAAFLLTSAAVATVIFADPLHHALETLFGLGAG